MKGKVKEGQATLEVVLQLAGKPNLALEFVVDTGFKGSWRCLKRRLRCWNCHFFARSD